MPEPERITCTLTQAEGIFGISRKKLTAWRDAGKLEFFNISNGSRPHYVVRIRDVQRVIESMPSNSISKPRRKKQKRYKPTMAKYAKYVRS
jgi:hypothetical protein